jgi:hypothetical protein
MSAACTNPASLDGGSGDLHSYLSVEGRTITGTTPPRPWLSSGAKIETPWVSAPGLLTAECTKNEYATYLEVTIHGDPAGPRTTSISGDVGGDANPQADWGLHLIDVNIAIGNLVDIVGTQTRSWLAKAAK